MKHQYRFWRMLASVSLLGALTTSAFAQAAPQPPAQLTYSTNVFPTVTGRSVMVSAAAGNLQQALDSALPGDEIVINAGDSFPGSFQLHVQCGADPAWIVIRTSDMAALPPLGTRIDPAVHAAAMPKILAKTNPVPALKTQQYTLGCFAQKYWIVGLEISVVPGLAFTGDLVELGFLSPSGVGETDPTHMARNIYVDRCYIHGAPSQGSGGLPTTHGVRLEAASLAIVNSHLSSFQDTVLSNKQGQAILAVDAIGPIQITNNYIEGSGENALFGGNDPATCSGPAGCQVISDITFTRNTVRKPLYWKLNDPSFVAGTPNWCIGNLFELKNAQRVLVDGNDFEYSWWTGCDGNLSQLAIQLTPRDQNGGDLAATVQDIQFTNNYVRHVPGGFNIAARDDLHQSQLAQRILISNNLLDDVSTLWNDGTHSAALGRTFMLHPPPSLYGGGPAGPDYVTIDHNTFVNDDASDNSYIYVDCGACNPQHIPHFTFTNNIAGEGKYGVMGVNASPGATVGASSTFNTYFDATLVFTGNKIVTTLTSRYLTAGGYPGNVSGNSFPTAWSNVGFDSYTMRDFHVPSGTAGADINTIDAHQSGGQPPPPPPPPPPSGLPPGWSTADIGATGVPGSASYSSGTFTVNGAGANIWGSADSFRFVYQSLAGDGQLIAHVTSFTNTTSVHAKAGIMIRSTLDPASPEATADFEPGDMEFLLRQTTGGLTTLVGGGPRTAPAWLKIVRSGANVSVFNSADGVAWTANGTVTFPTGAAFIGLVVCSHDTTNVASAAFDSVSQ